MDATNTQIVADEKGVKKAVITTTTSVDSVDTLTAQDIATRKQFWLDKITNANAKIAWLDSLSTQLK